MSVAHSALLTFNAALNRPAYQSSVYFNRYGSFNAILACDGNLETNATKDNQKWCSVSKNETNPWWAVDLGRLTTIYRVDLTNRADYGGMLLFCKIQLLFSYMVDVSDITLSFFRACGV